MENDGRVDGAHHETMCPVLIKGMVRQMNHPGDSVDEDSSRIAGHDVGLRPRIRRTHETDRAAAADVANRHVLSPQLETVEANDVEFPRRSLFYSFQCRRQILSNANIVFQDQGHFVGPFRDPPLGHAMAQPAANLAGRESQPAGNLRVSIDQVQVGGSKAGSVKCRKPLPAKPELRQPALDAPAPVRVLVEVDYDDSHRCSRKPCTSTT